MFECSSARYFDVRSITSCDTCDEAPLSRYTSGLSLTVCDKTGKSLRIFSTSHLLIVFTAVILMLAEIGLVLFVFYGWFRILFPFCLVASDVLFECCFDDYRPPMS